MQRPLAVLFLSLCACQSSSSSTPAAAPARAAAPAAAAGLPDRDIPLARRLISEGALVLDVRTQDEWNEGHHEKAHLVPIDVFPGKLDEIAQWNGGDRTRPVVVYCASGHRAGVAKQKLLAAGFTQVTNAGGYDSLR